MTEEKKKDETIELLNATLKEIEAKRDEISRILEVESLNRSFKELEAKLYEILEKLEQEKLLKSTEEKKP
jgi:uncharacterized protein YjhX (UPF0386 family)